MSKAQLNKAQAHPDQKLDAIFQVVVAEARGNKAFAERLRAALDDTSSASSQPRPTKSEVTTKSRTAKAAQTPDLHAINVLRQHGEQMLRGRLSNLRTKSDLLQVAKRSGLRLTGQAARKSASRPDLIDGIVEAAMQYDSQRQSVEG